MNLFGPTRQAEEFAAALSGGPTPTDAQLLLLVAVVDRVRASAPAPSADFRLSLRQQLMTAAQTELIPAQRRPTEGRSRQPVTPDTPSRRSRRLGALAGGAIVAGSAFSLVTVSANALPGELLYPIKRTTENVELLVRTDLATEGHLQLEHAATRLDEVDALTRSTDAGSVQNTRLISATLEDFTVQAQEGANDLIAAFEQDAELATIEQLNGFTVDAARQLSELAGVVPEGAGQEFADAADAVVELAARTSSACASCQAIAEGDLQALLSSTTEALDATEPLIPNTSEVDEPTVDQAGNEDRGGRSPQERPGNEKRNGTDASSTTPDDPAVAPGINQPEQPGDQPVSENPVDDPVAEDPVDEGTVGEDPVGEDPVEEDPGITATPPDNTLPSEVPDTGLPGVGVLGNDSGEEGSAPETPGDDPISDIGDELLP